MRTALLIAGSGLALLNCAAVALYASEVDRERRGLVNALLTLALLDLTAMLVCFHLF